MIDKGFDVYYAKIKQNCIYFVTFKPLIQLTVSHKTLATAANPSNREEHT